MSKKITLTKEAVSFVKKKQEELNKPDSFFSLSLKGGGCSGFTIEVDFTDNVDPTDKIFHQDDVKIAVNKKSYFFLIGTTVSYKDTLTSSGLEFEIPSATRKCGCGESISF